jgi:methyltransferase (TIGR00027 family)
MASDCSHQDQTRKNVSITAHGVAYLRGLESELYPDQPLFHDPFALILGGTIGKEWAEQTILNLHPEDSKRISFYSAIAIRTKKIDDILINIIQNHLNINQICVLGAGLDSRPWRLEALSASNLGRSIKYFELDFQEIFNYKLPVLKESEAKTVCEYISVNADLSLPSWSEKLIEKGWNAREGSLWLLEGLTGYLTLEENIAMFNTIRSLSESNSYLLATFITPIAGKKLGLALHRYMPEDPLELLRQCGGWEGEALDLADAAKEYNRLPKDIDILTRGYYLAIVHV